MAVAAIFIAAAGLRIWTIASLAADLRITDPALDSRYYMDLALQLARGEGWPSAPHFFGPLYPWLLSLLLRIAPAQPLTVQIAQSALGLGSLTLLFAATRRWLGPSAARGSAVLFALCGPLLAMENVLLMESLLMFLAAGALWLWPTRERNLLACLLFGVVCGLLVSGRGSFLLLPMAALLLALRARPGHRKSLPRSFRRWLVTAAAVTAGVILPLVPQTIHQTRATGHLQVLTLNGGMNFFVGNNPQARGIFSVPLGLDLNDDVTGRRSAENLAGRSLTLEESSSFWADRAWTFIREDPGREVWLLGRKLLLFLSPYEIPQVYNVSALREVAPPLRIAFVGFAWILPLAVVGAIAAGHRAQGFLALVLVGWLQVLIFFAAGRYRIVVLPGFLALAGLGIARLTQWVRAALRRRAPRPGRGLLWVLATAAAILVLHLLPPGYPESKARAVDVMHLGTRLTHQQRYEEALAQYQRAVEISPGLGEAWHGIGASLYRLGRWPEAAVAFGEALRRTPSAAITHYSLGLSLLRMGELERAATALGAAVRLNPRRADYHHDFGVALARLGRFDAAERAWRACLELDPGHRGAQESLQRLEHNAGREKGQAQ